jgi:DNA-directed RNA polymerase specialized sigma subunit
MPECGIEVTERWLNSIFNLNRELDFERENIAVSLQRIDELERQKEEIYGIIRAITNPTYKMILHKRYVQGKKWEDISDEIHYAPQHAQRLHKKAVAEVHHLRMTKK